MWAALQHCIQQSGSGERKRYDNTGTKKAMQSQIHTLSVGRCIEERAVECSSPHCTTSCWLKASSMLPAVGISLSFRACTYLEVRK